MNERIDEIAFDAGCHRHKYCNPKHPDLEGYIISQEALDKFAELIVRECAGIDFRFKVGMTTEQEFETGRAILEHFGVEE